MCARFVIMFMFFIHW